MTYKVITLFSLLLFAAITVSAQMQPGPKTTSELSTGKDTFISPDQTFSIELPNVPSTDEPEPDNGALPLVDIIGTYRWFTHDSTFYLVHSSLPALYKINIDEFAAEMKKRMEEESADHKFSSEKKGTFGKYQTAELRYIRADGRLEIIRMYVWETDCFYLSATMNKDLKNADKIALKVLDSFKILKKDN